MGFWDNLANLSPDQAQGLLAFAAPMLQAGGPSLRPVSIGQALGAGLTSYATAMDAARQRKMEEEQARQLAEMRALNIDDLRGQLADKATARQQALDAQSWTRNYIANQNSPTARAQRVLGSNLAPTVSNAAALNAAQADSGSENASSTQDQFAQRLAQAQAMRGSGNPLLISQADALEKSALEFRPKVKSWEKVNVGGRTLLKPYFEDGSAGAPVAADVAEKLQFQNLGGSTVALNPFTGARVSSYANSMSPDAAASNALGRDRLAFDRSQAGKPVFNAELGGFVQPPSADQPAGGLIPLAGGNRAPKMTEDQSKATGWLIQAQNAFKNMNQAIAADPAAAKPGVNDFISAIPSFGIGEAVGNQFRGSNRQMFMQGASSLSEALLRAATGAGVNKEEAAQKVRELTPVSGNSEEVIAQKMAAIPLYIESLKVRAGPGASQADSVLTGVGKPAIKPFVLNQLPGPTASGGWSISKVD